MPDLFLENVKQNVNHKVCRRQDPSVDGTVTFGTADHAIDDAPQTRQFDRDVAMAHGGTHGPI